MWRVCISRTAAATAEAAATIAQMLNSEGIGLMTKSAPAKPTPIAVQRRHPTSFAVKHDRKAVMISGAICSTAAMLASFMCANAAMKHAVESPSQSERDVSIRLIGAPQRLGMAERERDGADQQRAHDAAHEDDFTDRIGSQDLLHQHVVDGIRRHAATNGRNATLVFTQG